MKSPQPPERQALAKSDRYINREYSWLQFNRRVLEEAANPANPILERVKFLAIFESNLDEFYMVRVSGLIEQHEGGVLTLTPDGLTPLEQLEMIAVHANALRQEANQLWTEELEPALERSGIVFEAWDDLDEDEKATLTATFHREVFPLCTPLKMNPAPKVPFLSNRSLNMAVVLRDEDDSLLLARVKVPTSLNRCMPIPGRKNRFILLEDLILEHIATLFPGMPIEGAYRFRVIRDADIEIRELEAADLLSAVEESIRQRRFGDPVLLEIEERTPTEVRELLMRLLRLEESDTFRVDGLIGYDVLWRVASLDRSTLRFPTHTPSFPEQLAQPQALFETIRQHDLLVHHPFDSFLSVQQFVSAAAKDPDVVGIKMTLYRVGTESPIVEALLQAAEAGKQVAVLVELKARFDESNNLVWARALERAGVHVSYGTIDKKVHCKLCCLVRREAGSVRVYAHIGTGNYNPATSRIYTDLGLFTCDPEITQDVIELFNDLTGFSRQTQYRQLLVAPHNLRDQIIARIEREIELHRQQGNGRILIKLNSLVDPEVIEALYDASAAGVQVDLIVRGISCLRPGVPGLSENIRVISVVGRFLEHSRVYYFANGGEPEALIGSSDLMRRNLDRRIEVLTPVRSPKLVRLLLDQVLEVYLRDNTNTWKQNEDGTYQRLVAPNGGRAFTAQRHLMRNPLAKMQIRVRD